MDKWENNNTLREAEQDTLGIWNDIRYNHPKYEVAFEFAKNSGLKPRRTYIDCGRGVIVDSITIDVPMESRSLPDSLTTFLGENNLKPFSTSMHLGKSSRKIKFGLIDLEAESPWARAVRKYSREN